VTSRFLGKITLRRDFDDPLELSFGQTVGSFFQISQPHDSEAHNYLGNIYAKQKRWEEAVSEYEKALSNPIYSTPDFTHYNLGRVYKNMGKLEEAVASLQQSVRVNSGYAPAYFEMGEVYSDMGKVRFAIDSYKRALKSFPEYTHARYHLGLAYSKEGSKSLAEGEFHRVIEISPESNFGQESRSHLEQIRN